MFLHQSVILSKVGGDMGECGIAGGVFLGACVFPEGVSRQTPLEMATAAVGKHPYWNAFLAIRYSISQNFLMVCSHLQ